MYNNNAAGYVPSFSILLTGNSSLTLDEKKLLVKHYSCIETPTVCGLIADKITKTYTIYIYA